jgi:hypothetical protein
MATIQSTEEILKLLRRLVGGTISELQVLGINSLKSVTPSPADVVGSEIADVAVRGRSIDIQAGGYTISVDLQRTGKVRWLASAEPVSVSAPSRPTIRLLLEDRAGIDFTEPSKTKRITAAIMLT